MRPNTNRTIHLAKTPDRKLTPEHFELREGAIPEPGDGEILVRTLYIAIDASDRALIQTGTYRAALQPGEVMEARILGRVIASNHPDIAEGELVYNPARWADYSVLNGSDAFKVDHVEPLSAHMSMLEVTGRTAYYGLIGVADVKAGETVVISAAAGAVGTLACQIAKRLGCRVVAIAGGSEKCDWLEQTYGVDAAVDYKAGNLNADLKRVCPDGIDVYFDNVGGQMLETVINQMNLFGRVACCGAVSQYDGGRAHPPANVPGLLIAKRLTMRGYLAREDEFPEIALQAREDLRNWLKTGDVAPREDIIKGLENAPDALVGLLNGENKGKRMVQVCPDTELSLI